MLNQNVEKLFGELVETSKAELVNEPIINISRNISEEGSFEQQEGLFRVNPLLLKCLYHPNFERTIKNLLVLLIK